MIISCAKTARLDVLNAKNFLSGIFQRYANQQAISLGAMAHYRIGCGAQQQKYRPVVARM